MFEPNISIDVSLLAIILGSYATKNNRNLTLLLICLLFAHVLLTNEKEEDDLSADETETETETETENENDEEEGEEEDQKAVGAASAAGAVGAVGAVGSVSAETAQNTVPVPQAYKSTVSAGVFDRQLSTPQTNLTSTVFPSTSVEANGKLASARGSFFKSLVS